MYQQKLVCWLKKLRPREVFNLAKSCNKHWQVNVLTVSSDSMRWKHWKCKNKNTESNIEAQLLKWHNFYVRTFGGTRHWENSSVCENTRIILCGFTEALFLFCFLFFLEELCQGRKNKPNDVIVMSSGLPQQELGDCKFITESLC